MSDKLVRICNRYEKLSNMTYLCDQIPKKGELLIFDNGMIVIGDGETVTASLPPLTGSTSYILKINHETINADKNSGPNDMFYYAYDEGYCTFSMSIPYRRFIITLLCDGYRQNQIEIDASKPTDDWLYFINSTDANETGKYYLGIHTSGYDESGVSLSFIFTATPFSTVSYTDDIGQSIMSDCTLSQSITLRVDCLLR